MTGLQNCDILPYANQIELHLFYQQEDYVRFLQEKGIPVKIESNEILDIKSDE